MKIELKADICFLRAMPVDVRKSYAFPAVSNWIRGSAAALKCVMDRRHSRRKMVETDGEAELRRTSRGKAPRKFKSE